MSPAIPTSGNDIQKLREESFAAGSTLCKDDLLIICGDAGIVWLDEAKDRELAAWYDSRPWTTVYWRREP